MSFGQSSLQAGDTLHVIGFPDLVRLGAQRLQIQLANGCLCFTGRGMDYLLRDLLAGSLTEVQLGRNGLGIHVERIDVTAVVEEDTEPYRVGESCPVADDLIFLESDTNKDYLARSELTFFGRLGRPSSTFVLGLRDRSYRITTAPEQADALCAAVMASRFAPGSANIFTTLAPDYFLPWAEVYRHQVARVEETEHRPQDWSSAIFVATIHVGTVVQSAPAPIHTVGAVPSSPSAPPEI